MKQNTWLMLSILTAASLVLAPVGFATDINPSGFAIPDLTNAKFAKSFYHDFTDKIDGEETRLDSYYLKNSSGEHINVNRVSINERTFMYGLENLSNSTYFAIFDRDGDGIFELRYTEEELIRAQEGGKLIPDWCLKK